MGGWEKTYRDCGSGSGSGGCACGPYPDRLLLDGGLCLYLLLLYLLLLLLLLVLCRPDGRFRGSWKGLGGWVGGSWEGGLIRLLTWSDGCGTSGWPRRLLGLGWFPCGRRRPRLFLCSCWGRGWVGGWVVGCMDWDWVGDRQTYLPPALPDRPQCRPPRPWLPLFLCLGRVGGWGGGWMTNGWDDDHSFSSFLRRPRQARGLLSLPPTHPPPLCLLSIGGAMLPAARGQVKEGWPCVGVGGRAKTIHPPNNHGAASLLPSCLLQSRCARGLGKGQQRRASCSRAHTPIPWGYLGVCVL